MGPRLPLVIRMVMGGEWTRGHAGSPQPCALIRMRQWWPIPHVHLPCHLRSVLVTVHDEPLLNLLLCPGE